MQRWGSVRSLAVDGQTTILEVKHVLPEVESLLASLLGGRCLWCGAAVPTRMSPVEQGPRQSVAVLAPISSGVLFLLSHVAAVQDNWGSMHDAPSHSWGTCVKLPLLPCSDRGTVAWRDVHCKSRKPKGENNWPGDDQSVGSGSI